MEKSQLASIKNKIIVMSGKGGVGKSSVAVNLAFGLAMDGFRVGILDVDLHGPSVAKMSGIEDEKIIPNADGKIIPVKAISNVHVLSLASLISHQDEPVILRGPAKIGLIKQLIEETLWPELDYLVVDCPPGTGDEPLSVIQQLGTDSKAVIVTTPQAISLLDVRKSIKFAQKLEMEILGLVENMSGFICPDCDKRIEIFKSGGTEKAATDFNLEILGKLPLHAAVAESGDLGKPFVFHYAKTAVGREFDKIVERIIIKTSK